MRLLLDTHVWVWMLTTPDRLSPAARRLVAPLTHDLLLSAASAWELSVKYRVGKIQLPGDPILLGAEWMTRTRVIPLPILHQHAFHVASLPLHHHDPFDRLLIAQAQIEGIPIVTSDPDFERYDVTVKHAG